VSGDIVEQLSWFVMNEVRMPAGLIVTVIDEIERLRAAGDDLAEALRVNQGKGAASAFMSHLALTGWKAARREQ
jgi:hypothetical protein